MLQYNMSMKTHLKLKYKEISSIHEIDFSCPVIMKFCTEHDSITAVLCAIFQMIGNYVISYGQIIYHENWVERLSELKKIYSNNPLKVELYQQWHLVLNGGCPIANISVVIYEYVAMEIMHQY